MSPEKQLAFLAADKRHQLPRDIGNYLDGSSRHRRIPKNWNNFTVGTRDKFEAVCGEAKYEELGRTEDGEAVGALMHPTRGLVGIAAINYQNSAATKVGIYQQGENLAVYIEDPAVNTQRSTIDDNLGGVAEGAGEEMLRQIETHIQHYAKITYHSFDTNTSGAHLGTRNGNTVLWEPAPEPTLEHIDAGHTASIIVKVNDSFDNIIIRGYKVERDLANVHLEGVETDTMNAAQTRGGTEPLERNETVADSSDYHCTVPVVYRLTSDR